MLKLYSDAAVSQKNQLAGAGLVVAGDNLHEQLNVPLDDCLDNHLAELKAFYLAVKWVHDHDRTQEWAVFHTDSQLVAQSIRKNHMKNPTYVEIFNDIQHLLSQLSFYEVKWIPEKLNKGADNLAKQAIARQLKQKTSKK